MTENISEKQNKPKLDFIIRSLSKRGFHLFVRVVDKYAPDRVLLLGLNFLDKRIPNRLISFAIKWVEKLAPRKLISKLIDTADEYVPDEVANSRKVCSVLASLGKYIPEELIPPESTGKWDNLRAKFHIPRLISSKPK